MRWLKTVSILALLSSSLDAQAYCLRQYSGKVSVAKWEKPPVGYKISQNVTADQSQAIDAAFAAWSKVSCSTLSFVNRGTFSPAQVKFEPDAADNGFVYVFWYDSQAGFPTDPKFPAYSFSGHNAAGGITVGSIAINAFAFKWNHTGGDAQNSVLDIQNVMTYLIGTVIGLADSNSAQSVMAPQFAYGDTSKQQLKQDDIDGLVHLYGDGSCSAPTPGATGCSTGFPPQSDGGAPRDGGGVAADGSSPTSDGGVSVDGGARADAGVVGDAGGIAPTDGGGCACRSAPGAPTASPLLGLLMFGLLRRRRCERQRNLR
ncbi:MAG: matrixin family metalloprotease [Deltaproteobacteria bacterium]|nr:matrixin family metalloprotease [Deltaproteobacteria bacterium]